MTLQSSGAISLTDILAEFGGVSGPGISLPLSQYYAGGSFVAAGTMGYPGGVSTPIPSSGAISFSNFYGATSVIPIGIIAGGYQVNVGSINRINGLRYSNETNISIASTLTSARDYARTMHAISKSYFLGGQTFNSSTSTWTPRDVIDGIRYSDYSGITVSAVLAFTDKASANAGTNSNGSIAGFTYGKLARDLDLSYSYVVKFAFPSETYGIANAISWATNFESGAAFSSGTKGYWIAGMTTYAAKGGSVYTTEIRYIDYSTESAIIISNTAPSAKSYNTAFNTVTDGYSDIQYSVASAAIKFNFATETVTVISSAPTGYAFGGYSGAVCRYANWGAYWHYSSSGAPYASNTVAKYAVSTGTYSTTALTIADSINQTSGTHSAFN